MPLFSFSLQTGMLPGSAIFHCGSSTKSFPAAIFGTLFILAGPINIQLYAALYLSLRRFLLTSL